jgi:protein ImuB
MTDRLIRSGRSPAPPEGPLVVVEPVKGALRLAGMNDMADGLGLRPGMALADARAMYPRIAVADADPDADRRMLSAIADWCDRYTPLVGLDPPDGLLLDITGCAHLFGGEEALRRDIVARLVRQGFQARAAVADTVGCAWAVARYGKFFLESADDDVVRGNATRFPSPLRGRDREGGGGKLRTRSDPPPHLSPNERAFTPVFDGLWGEEANRDRVTLLVPSARTREALLPLPLAALRIAPETVADLAQVGLKRIADVIDRPRAPLAARFGEAFVHRIDQALGRADEPISPRLPVPPYVTERRFADPIALEADVLGTIEHLARELVKLMERRGEGARLIEAALFRTDGKVHRIVAGTGAPLRDAARIRALFVERLAAIGDEVDPGFGYDVVRLGAMASERCDPAQTGLVASDHAAEELTHLIDRLGARFGLRRVTRIVPQDTHIPEFAVAAVAAATYRAAAATYRNVSTNTSLEMRSMAPQHPLPLSGGRSRASLPQQRFSYSQPEQDSLAPVRPIRLFERPEPIEATAEVPDGAPIQFKWRQLTYQVAHAEGPERIAMDWWRDDKGEAVTRDYFRVESKEGIRAWLFRKGSYTSEPKEPQWYLHGFFA